MVLDLGPGQPLPIPNMGSTRNWVAMGTQQGGFQIFLSRVEKQFSFQLKLPPEPSAFHTARGNK
jgi:hypothetical protein